MSSVLTVPLARGGRVCLGVARSAWSGVWIVWLSVFGNDIEPLTGWTDRKQADAALTRYVAVLRNGHQHLRDEVERGRSEDGYVPGRNFSPRELVDLSFVAREMLG